MYESVPMFQQIGGAAYKPGLATTQQLDKHFGHPHRQFKSIHVAGTNGKGSCSHSIAAVLQSAGYKVGLFTSPHLLDFRERIRVNGEMIPESYVVRFVEKHRPFFEPLHPSFFELTTIMAFRYFADCQVDIAVVEVGMGGRLDCTNIIQPEVSIITGISLDHTQYLGDTLEKIATEKAGIIKPHTPVVTAAMPPHVMDVFRQKAQQEGAPLHESRPQGLNTRACITTPAMLQRQREELRTRWKERCRRPGGPAADDAWMPIHLEAIDTLLQQQRDALYVESPVFCHGMYFGLTGMYQVENLYTVWEALRVLADRDIRPTYRQCLDGLLNVCTLTGLMGRWQQLHTSPDLVCDTGHNPEAFAALAVQFRKLRAHRYPHIHVVLGMCGDKDVESILALLPPNADGFSYYFTRASVKRALPEDELQALARAAGLQGDAYPDVAEAVKAAKEKSLPEELIFVGGSNFIVADLLANRDALNLH